jgi:hypothetical protein
MVAGGVIMKARPPVALLLGIGTALGWPVLLGVILVMMLATYVVGVLEPIRRRAREERGAFELIEKHWPAFRAALSMHTRLNPRNAEAAAAWRALAPLVPASDRKDSQDG